MNGTQPPHSRQYNVLVVQHLYPFPSLAILSSPIASTVYSVTSLGGNAFRSDERPESFLSWHGLVIVHEHGHLYREQLLEQGWLVASKVCEELLHGNAV